METSLQPYTVIVISMDTPLGAERRARLNFPFQHRIVGARGADAPAAFRARFRFMHTASESRKDASIGVTWSHRLALQRILDLRLQRVIVLEDDARFVRALPPPGALPEDQPIALGGMLTTPGAWHRKSKEFPSATRKRVWSEMREGLNEIDRARFSLVGSEALYIPTPDVARTLADALDHAHTLKVLDTFYRKWGLVKFLYHPNPFAACDAQGSEFEGCAPSVRDLYLANAKEIREAQRVYPAQC